ncbi:MAG: 16S rRNA (cytosine(967)-C(5))-methyltransferase RsmB [Gammaproteobacteria bacterium]|nr:16S rRNA (cytosine(967)-C(5))-methyltransferase RsmB [Gammaproteobacteria bacterium]
MSNVRQVAAEALADILRDGASLTTSLPNALDKVANEDRPLLQELVYGCLRWLPRLEFSLAQLLRRPLRKRELELHCLMIVGLYQLLETRIPPHAAVSETVDAAKLMNKQWAVGVVNAVLRRMQRERDQFAIAVNDSEVAQYAHSQWLIDAIKHDWPNHWRRILEQNNCHAPMSLRVNLGKITRAAYLEMLDEHNIEAAPFKYGAAGLVLAAPSDVGNLPGFSEGLVSVQDGAAQLAAGLLDLEDGHRVLDACAAPGGKTGHILEQCPGLAEMVALDVDAERLDRVAENLARLDLAATLVAGDAGKPDNWWDGKPFDRILLDAPCTATGVIRRHPDIKLHRQRRDVDALAGKQARLLDAVWELLKPGGKLVYSTCSLLLRENAEQIASFTGRRPNALALPLAVDWGLVKGFGRQIFPGDAGMDGFYYSVLVKQA